MKRIILTGGIASGKSTVAKLLKEKGIEIIDADRIAKNVFKRNTKEIQKMFDTNYTGDELRSLIRNTIFCNPEKKLLFEQFMHPKIRNIIQQRSKLLQKNNIKYIIDIPLYFETKNFDKSDFVILIKTTYEKQLERLMKRNNLTKDEADKMILSQLPAAIKEKKSNYVIDNSYELDNLEKSVDNLIKCLNL